MDIFKDLLNEAKSGNKQAENELFLKLRERITGLVQYKLQNVVKDYSELQKDVEDIVQNAMITVLEKYKNEEFLYGFFAFVNAVVWNKVGDYYRYLKTHQLEHDILEYLTKSVLTYSSELAKNDMRNIILRSLPKEKKQCKKIFIAFIEDKIDIYISELKKMNSESAIFNKIHRCRKLFMKILKEEGYVI